MSIGSRYDTPKSGVVGFPDDEDGDEMTVEKRTDSNEVCDVRVKSGWLALILLSVMKMGRREARRWMLMRNTFGVSFSSLLFLSRSLFLFFPNLTHASALRLIHLPLSIYACSIHTFYLF